MFIVAPKSSATYTFTKDSETAIVVAGGGTGYGIVTLNGAASGIITNCSNELGGFLSSIPDKNFAFDLEGLNGEYYVGYDVYASTSQLATIYDLWLE